ncbi:MAG: energy transducer TonB [Alphaproteobacteria bacterium]|nr:energy transducer TonB [Alphaproteobacteria bacterium]
MGLLVDLFHKGGPFMFPILGALILALLGALIGGGLALAKVRVPLAAWLLLPALMVVTGALGTAQGTTTALEAIAHASAEYKSLLAAAGYSFTLIIWVFGLTCAAIALTASALALAAGTALGAGQGATMTWVRALAAGSLTLLGVGAAGVLALMSEIELVLWIPVTLLFGGLACAIAGLRQGAPGPDEDRVAAGAVGVGVMSALAVAACALAVHASGRVVAYEAMAHATPDLLGVLLAAAERTQDAALQVGATGVLVAVITAGFLSMPALGLLSELRTQVSAVLIGLMGFTVAGMAVVQEHTLGELEPWTPVEVMKLARAAVPVLPSTELPAGLRGPPLQSVIGFPIWVQQGGRWMSVAPGMEPSPVEDPRLEPSGHQIIAVEPTLPARDLLALGEGGLLVLVQPVASGGGFAVASVEMSIEPAEEAWPLLLVVEEGVAVPERERPILARSGASGAEALAAQVAQKSAASVVLVPGPRWTVQDLVTLCLAAKGEAEDARCVVESEVPDNNVVLRRLEEESHTYGDDPFGDRGLGERGSRGGSLSADDPIILGAVDKEAIESVVRRHSNQLRYCYERGLQNNPELEGKVTVKFVIAKDGSVSKSTLKASTLEDSAVEDCVVRVFERMAFPEPKGGGIAIVSYPVILRPG